MVAHRESLENYDQKRINRFNLILIAAFSTMLSVTSFFTAGAVHGYFVLILSVLAFLGALLFYFLYAKKVINGTVTGILMCLVPVISGLLLSFLRNGESSARVFLMIAVTICMAALYYRTHILLIFSGIVNLLLVISFWISPRAVLGPDATLQEFLGRMFILDSTLLVMYFMTKWGHEYIQSIFNKEKKVNELFQKLTATMQQITESTNRLNENIRQSDESIQSIKDVSEVITKGIQEVAKGTSEDANSISRIAEMMEEATQLVVEMKNHSTEVSSISREVNTVVLEGAAKIDRMEEQMGIIRNAIGIALENVTELQQAIANISSFLTSIAQVTKKTNLLALNASIEAARAGESGTGFAVVANEVRALAAQSDTIAAQINGIIVELQQKTQSAFEKVNQGNSAVEEGNAIMRQVYEGFKDMQQSFQSIDEKITDEHRKINNVTEDFATIQQNLEEMAAISEENAAATQEIMASMEEQNSRLINIAKAMRSISNLSSELEALTE